ncbi:MAG: hypothetical protein DMF69_17950 [Acidobacteria bacterium]|nr:MAG: hypothetical protein DMF69_17950 [Acidobacteriota bacterium]
MSKLRGAGTSLIETVLKQSQNAGGNFNRGLLDGRTSFALVIQLSCRKPVTERYLKNAEKSKKVNHVKPGSF